MSEHHIPCLSHLCAHPLPPPGRGGPGTQVFPGVSPEGREDAAFPALGRPRPWLGRPHHPVVSRDWGRQLCILGAPPWAVTAHIQPPGRAVQGACGGGALGAGPRGPAAAPATPQAARPPHLDSR